MSRSVTISKSDDSVHLVETESELQIENEVWTLGFEIEVSSNTTNVSFGLKSGQVLYGFDFFMREGDNK